LSRDLRHEPFEIKRQIETAKRGEAREAVGQACNLAKSNLILSIKKVLEDICCLMEYRLHISQILFVLIPFNSYAELISKRKLLIGCRDINCRPGRDILRREVYSAEIRFEVRRERDSISFRGRDTEAAGKVLGDRDSSDLCIQPLDHGPVGLGELKELVGIDLS